MGKKTIELVTYGYVRFHGCSVPWDDIWVRFFKGRKKVYLGPCVMSVEHENESYRYLREKRSEPGYESGLREWYASLNQGKESQEWIEQRVKETLEVEPDPDIVLPKEGFFSPDPETGTPNIFVQGPVTREKAEAAIAWYLRKYHGVTADMRFRWRNEKFRLCSV